MKQLMVTAAVAGVYESEKGAVLADELLCGMGAELLQRCEGGILRVRSFYGYEGYVKGDNMAREAEVWRDAPKLIVTGSYINLQQQSAVRSPVVTSLPRGALCRVDSEVQGGTAAEGWRPVCLCGGQSGYVQAVHLSPYPMGTGLCGDALRHSLCQNALSYMGCCYRWGGKTPLGIDCSGLCSQVYLNHGIAIHRDASIAAGYPIREIAREALNPADLLYWKGHMALWLGDGRYIHSSASSGGVTVSSLVKGEAGYREDLANSITAYGSAF